MPALLAKRPEDPAAPHRRETLVGHVEDTVNTAQAIVSSIGSAALHSAGLPDRMLGDLRRATELAAGLHDLGKANSQFQRAVEAGNHPPQALRHEWISVWCVLSHREFDAWLFAGFPPTLRQAVLTAVLGHHLKVKDGSAVKARVGSGDTSVRVLMGQEDFRQCLSAIQRTLALDSPPQLNDCSIDLVSSPLRELRRWLPEALEWHNSSTPESKRFVALVKALLIAADVAASAVPRYGLNPKEWTLRVLSRKCTAEDLESIALTRLHGQSPRQFQSDVAASREPVTLVTAGCGTGKTVAAYMWAQRRAVDRKLFFCYPTTGTATQGFRDYVIPSEMAPDCELLHSRAECDLQDMLHAGIVEADDDPRTRIESLAAWDVPLVISTADLVLGLMRNSRRSLFAFPCIAKAAFIFDEVHQYDDVLFGLLLRFVDVFRGAPLLLMTASLPRNRLDALRSTAAQAGCELPVITGPQALQELKRYVVRGIQDDVPWQEIEKTLMCKGKVLWVCNTVSRCICFACRAYERGLSPLIYHSRYRYCDRISRHNCVIEAFRAEGPALALTTQVCEVSLDLSADLLVSDIAPIPALIQRMGRLNRRAQPDDGIQARPAIFLSATSSLPYGDELDQDLVAQWITAIGNVPSSQADLARAFEALADADPVGLSRSEWLDGGPFAPQGPVRGPGATVPIVMAQDERNCLDRRGRPAIQKITRYAIPMLLGPVARQIGSWKRLGFAFVAPAGSIEYSQEWGAQWNL